MIYKKSPCCGKSVTKIKVLSRGSIIKEVVIECDTCKKRHILLIIWDTKKKKIRQKYLK